MAKRKSTVRRPTVRALAERQRLDLIGVHAAVAVAASWLTQRGGVDQQLGIMLLRGAVNPLAALLNAQQAR